LSEREENQRLRALVVDDNQESLKIMVKFLSKNGLVSDIAWNGKEAMDAAGMNDYDIIFMDCEMPLMDGYEASRQIRKAQSDGRPVIVAITANVMPGDKEKCLDAGMNDCLSKPVTYEQLEACVQKWVSLKGKTAEDRQVRPG
jgi:CheY-like chemotaxis protein